MLPILELFVYSFTKIVKMLNLSKNSSLKNGQA